MKSHRAFARPRQGARIAVVGLSLLAAGFVTIAGEPPALPPLTTVSGSPRLPGKFVWADLVTYDVAAARDFYARLFGWTFRDIGGYSIAANDERPLCGIFQRPRPADQAGARPRWFGYISVTNVEKVQRAATKHGGRVLAPLRKMPARGEQALLADSEGALFGVLRSSAGDPQDFLPDPGDWVWAQLLSLDAKKAVGFYHEVTGYEAIENTSGGSAGQFVLTSQGYARATIRTLPGNRPKPAQAEWLLFVRVKSVSDSVAKASQLGGKVLIAPKPELFDGKVAVIADPTGAPIGLLEWSPEALKGVR